MYHRLLLGGKERGLSFKMGALRHIGELTKQDPLDFTTVTDFSNQYAFIKTIVHAGLLCNCDIKGIEPDFTENDVVKWVDDLDAKQATEITAAFSKAFSVKGEDSSDTQG